MIIEPLGHETTASAVTEAVSAANPRLATGFFRHSVDVPMMLGYGQRYTIGAQPRRREAHPRLFPAAEL